MFEVVRTHKLWLLSGLRFKEWEIFGHPVRERDLAYDQKEDLIIRGSERTHRLTYPPKSFLPLSRGKWSRNKEKEARVPYLGKSNGEILIEMGARVPG